ncbi:MAG: anaerobic ribonucleoside-triphosphate reductase, partial [Clostridium sp.]|nr:anaerobic ribonucleoside-triphosphate reductase [Clostridium sp.]
LAENDLEDTEIYEMHNIVEAVLEEFYPLVAKMYKEYRNYKKDFVHMMDKVYERSQAIRYIGDKSNANTDSALVATKRSLIYNELSGELYKKFFLTLDEKQAMKDGYIYIHDRSARLDTFNCCLMRIGDIMQGGFEMGNVWYNEPNSLDTAFDVMGDIILSTAAQQYGGFTVPEVDKILSLYAEKSYWKYRKEYADVCGYVENDNNINISNTSSAEEWVMSKIQRDFEQGWQGIEYKLNTVGSSRGDYPFVTMTIGLATDKFGKMAAITLLNVHKEGQGKKGFKRPVLFPKIVFLYDKNLHGDGSDRYPSADVFNVGIDCSSKTMYPDWLSLTGNGYVPDMYKKYGRIVSPMGCRAFLSPWYEKGGMHPVDEEDKPAFEGRCNLGVVSLHLPMILAKARQESKDFYEVLEYYLELIRGLHKRTYDYIGELRASVNPIAFCEGGLYGGNLKPDEKIKSILPPMTISYGITALNELQRLYNGKSIREDGEFALEVMQYIQKYVNRIKEEDHILYAIYGTPAESLCGLQIEQFRKIYGIIENVSDKPYVSNSFHCHVSEQMSPIEKQDKEERFWSYFNGGKIQYCRYNLGYNIEAIKTLVLRAMEKGFYEGVNLAMCYCEDCGYQQVEMDICPKCGSSKITKIDRMNGYLGFTRVHGETRYNEAKNAEISDRVSM